MESFRALLVSKTDDGQKAEFVRLTEADLMEGDVTIDVAHSSINYKDGLAVTGKGPIIRKFPLIPGIDIAGTVKNSSNPNWKVGDKVVLGGWGVGEGHHGGFSEVARVKGEWLVPLPQGFSTADAMAVGVAGYTAMLCVMALEDQGVVPSQGEILVTGAAGGVGSVAIAILSKLGFTVVAATGRPEEEAYLKSLGAASIIDRKELTGPVKPLANAISQVLPEGTVAATGLAGGMDLPTSVAPFILRGVRLIGVNSVTTPEPRRRACWQRLVRDLDMTKLKAMTRHVKLDDVPAVAAEIVAGKVRGRVVVDIR